MGNIFIADGNNQRIRKVTPGGVISTVAGTGTYGYNGDGIQATSANLSNPTGVAVDASGNLYIADQSSSRVRKVTPGGVISTVAGTGTYGYNGDGIQATSANLNSPTGVAVDGSGNLYIADQGSSRVRKVTPGGVISTVAGTGTSGYNGDGIQATAANLSGPSGVAVDGSGNLYIADQGNSRVRKVTPGGVISTVAGTGTSGYNGDGIQATAANLSGPSGVAVDGSGNLYIADQGNSRVRKVIPGGVISTVAGTGTSGYNGDGIQATSAKLYQPNGVSIDGAGNFYISEYNGQRVRKVTTGGIISTVAGNGKASYGGDGGSVVNARFYEPYDVAVDASSNLFVADLGNYRVRKITSGGIITTVAGTGNYGSSGDGGAATNADIVPFRMAVDAGGNLFIADPDHNRVRKVTPGGTISTVAGTGNYGFSGDGGPAINAQLSTPIGITFDAQGNLFIADASNSRIRKVTPGGTISTVAGTGNYGFSGDGGPAINANLAGPYDLAFDVQGNLFIADAGNYRIRKVTPGGTITTVAGTGTQGYNGDGGPAINAQLDTPYGLAVDVGGNLFITDQNSHRVRKVTPGGIITTIAGTGTQGFGGDGGPAINANLSNPEGIKVDMQGNLLFADAGNNRIRKISLNTAPTVATTIPSQTATVGQAFSYTLPANAFTDSESPNSLTYTASIVPPNGLVYNAVSRVISGTPTATGVSNVTVVATDPGSLSASQTFTITVNCPLITASLAGSATVCVGSPATLAVSLSGGSGPYSLTYSNGSSTSVVSNYTSGAAITVSPTVSTTYTLVSVRDGAGCAATVSGTAVVMVSQPPSVASAGASQTTTFGSSVVLAGNTPTVGTGNWSVSSGPSTGAAQFSSLTDPMATFRPANGPGEYVLTWTISNAPCPASVSSTTITVIPANTAPVATSNANQTATVGMTFSYTVNAFTDDTPNSLTYSASIVPANGLSFDPATRIISGTPTASGVSSVTITATDPGSLSASTTFTITVNCPLIMASLAGSATVCVGSPATLAVSLSGGSGPYSLTYSDGSSTSVVSNYTSGAAIAVSPATSTAYTLVSVRDGAGCAATVSGTAVVMVNQPPSVASAGASQTITAGSATLGANTPTVGTGSWSVSSGPSTAASQFSSTTSPTATFTPAGGVGSYVLTWTISNPPCASNSSSLTITVIPANTAPVATSNANQTATVGVAFSYTVNAFTDAESPSSLSYSASIVPANGFSFDAATRVISGTPSMSGVSSVTITATDPGSLSASTTFTITVSPAPVAALTVVATANPTMFLTTESSRISANVSGGTTPYQTLIVTGPGTITPGLGFATVSNVPAGVQTFTVTVTDAASQTASGTVSVTVTQANTAPVATPNANQTATVGVAFSYTVNAFTDDTPSSLTYSASIVPPNGFSFDPATRIISGTPTASGVSSVTITATDPGSLSASTTFTITVSPAPVVITPLALTLTANPTMLTTSGTTTLSATVSGGTTPYSYTFTGPGTISQSPTSNTASVSGIPAGVQTYTVVARDATAPTSQTISGTVSVTVLPANTAPVATSNANQTATVGVAFSYTVNAFTDDTPNSLTYSVSIVPPNGFSFDPATRVISGTPSMSGVSSVTVTATDPGNLSASTSFSITVSPVPVTPPPTATFSITGVTTVSCETISAGQRRVTFNPRYAGLDGTPVSFSVVNELAPTTNPGPYVLRLYTDNPVITLQAVQSGASTSFAYNWLSACSSSTANTPPSVANPVSPQSATVGLGYTLSLANVFTDAETPNGLSLSVMGLPSGLNFVAPSTISGTPSMSGVSSVTVTATDPGSLSASTTFTITISPAGATPPPPSGTFSITSVTTISCEVLSAGQRRLTFNPQYVGLNGAPVSFSVVNELAPTTNPGPYVLNLYTDNPVITLQAVQSGISSSFAYNWLSACSSSTANTAPTVVNPVAPQSATVGVGYTLSLANVFTDAETPNQLTLSVVGLPVGLSFTAPSTISGTPSMSGVNSVTVTATDPGSLSASNTFTLTVSPAGATPPPPSGTFSITGVTTVSCEVLSAGERRLTFNPRYAGLNGSPVSFSVANELAATTNPGSYVLRLYTDNPVITLKAMQSGVQSSFAYGWLAACTPGARPGVDEGQPALTIRLLENPSSSEWIGVEIRGAAGQPLRLTTLDSRGHLVSEQVVIESKAIERQTIRVGPAGGVYLLRVSTLRQAVTSKILKQ